MDMRDLQFGAKTLTREDILRCLYSGVEELILSIWNGFVGKKGNLGLSIPCFAG
jgi:hypothetical protein